MRLSARHCLPPDVPVQGGSLLCGFSLAPDAPVRGILLLALPVVSFYAAPSSPSLLSSRFMFLVFSLIRSLFLFIFSLPGLPFFLATAASSSFCSPGRSNPGPLASSPDVPVLGFCPPAVSVRLALLPAGTFFPGCFSPGSVRLPSCHFVPPDTPVQVAPLLFGFF